MAELSTIARPYAQGLWKALGDKPGDAKVRAISEMLDALADAASDPGVSELVSDPKLTKDQIFEGFKKALGKGVPQELEGLLLAVIGNGRLAALSEIALQFRTLKNQASGVADAYIESAFEMKATQVKQLMKSLEKKFPGVKLNPIVVVNPDLIGGVSVRVGDQILDGSVRARLAQMQAALTA